jgi:hypothetical protein
LKDSFNGSRHFNTQATLFLTFLFPFYIYNMAFLLVFPFFFFMWDVFVWIQVNKVELRGCNIKYCGQNKGFGVFSSNDVSDGNQNLFINLYIHICALYGLVVDWKRWLFVWINSFLFPSKVSLKLSNFGFLYWSGTLNSSVCRSERIGSFLFIFCRGGWGLIAIGLYKNVNW